ncbi:hypothetical protein JK359_05930 [Streptomyces actinomycinicus]|uniref:Excreted virulence factor EspC (Type VII ESX diderm) n=2 Tax=Streptomyces actinomycinicus TaxID=1695166 RepID=A0A937JNJ7_9ACTN|nr:hypothetical protein [Streptomyces actinomycinicus]
MTGGHGPRNLVSTPERKRAAAAALEARIEPGTRRAGAWADDQTGAAVKAFGARDGDGWAAAGALRTAHETWSGQVKNLLDRLGAEKDALRAANTVLTGTDTGTGAALRKLSALDRY